MDLVNLLDFFIFFIPIGFIFIYFVMISDISNTWDHLDETLIIDRQLDELNSFSIIIPTRNEADNIRQCITSLINLDYPKEKIEIIVVDDHSSDHTVEIARLCKVTVIKLDGINGKKAALNTGITAAKHPWIWTLDADTVLHHKAAKILNEKIILHNPHFVACPVIIEPNKSVLSRFQFLDMAAMMAITSHGIYRKTFYLANGANMAFLKSAFDAVNGFTGNENIASGDDVFLIKKMAEYDQSKIHFLKSSRAAVITKPMQTYADFFDQRKRWAAKTKSYATNRLMKIQGYVFFIHLLVVTLLLCGIFFDQGIAFFSGVFFLFIKAIIDFLFLSKVAHFFNYKKALKSFIPAFFFYFIYIFYTAYQAAFPSKFIWKERKLT